MSLKETRASLPEPRLTTRNLLIGVMPRGHYTALDTNSRISKREQRSLHRGLLGGMTMVCTMAQRGEIRFNPNLSSGPDYWLRERVCVSRLAQWRWREDAIVTRAVERELAAIAAGRVAVPAGDYF